MIRLDVPGLKLIFIFSQLQSIYCANKIIPKGDGAEVSPAVLNSDPLIQLQCFNGGTYKNGVCACVDRFEGEQCEIEPCLNGGKKSAESTCHCPWATTGSRCEKVTHCENNGKLVDGKCICAERWSGIFCHMRLCYNGDFIGQENNGYCRCDKGFTGPFCSQRLVCIHGRITDDNKCVCEPNWTGDRCDRCAIDHRLVGNECKIIVNEESLVAPQKASAEAVDLWSAVIIGCAIAFVVALIVAISTVLLKKRQTKPTKIDSTLGTDV